MNTLLTVTGLTGRVNTRRSPIVKCLCKCGNTVERSLRALRSHKSCGCLIHQEAYKVWAQMKYRCTAKKSKDYKNYGAKGIEVCSAWSRDFWTFITYMGWPEDGLTIERNDNTKGYEPGNCRWATSHEQAQNRSTTKLTPSKVLEIRSRRTEPQAILAKEFGVHQSAISRVQRNTRWGNV